MKSFEWTGSYLILVTSFEYNAESSVNKSVNALLPTLLLCCQTAELGAKPVWAGGDAPTVSDTAPSDSATDSAADALDWKELNPGSDLAVSSELAARTGLPSTGFSNTEMTADVEDLFERLSDTPSLWDAFPWLLLASTSVSVVTRVRGHPFDEPIGRALVKLTAVTLGRKATKMGSLLFLLSLPVIGAFTGAVIALRVLLALRKLTVTEDRARARRGPSLEAFHA